MFVKKYPLSVFSSFCRRDRDFLKLWPTADAESALGQRLPWNWGLRMRSTFRAMGWCLLWFFFICIVSCANKCHFRLFWLFLVVVVETSLKLQKHYKESEVSADSGNTQNEILLLVNRRDERTVKFLSPSPILIRIRSSPEPQNFWKSSILIRPCETMFFILPHEQKHCWNYFSFNQSYLPVVLSQTN